MGESLSLLEHVSALITVNLCVCVSCGTFQCSDHYEWLYQTCQCSDHYGWVCLCLCWNISVLLSLWMGVSVSLVEHVSAVTTVDGCICVSLAIYRCSDHSGWIYLYLWWNMSVLWPLWMGVSVSLVQHGSALTNVAVCLSICWYMSLL